MNKTVNCPTCKKELTWSKDYPFRPFCSERCKLIDLGDWVSGANVIAGDTAFTPDDDS